MTYFKKISALFCAFALIFTSVPLSFAADDTEKNEDRGLIIETKKPEIHKIHIQNKRESSGAVVMLEGKNLGIGGRSSVSVSFPVTEGGRKTVGSFSYSSPVTLIFSLPQNLTAGNAYVTVDDKNGAKSKTSEAFFFDYHPPEILFISGEKGVGPGKKVKVWGNHFDGLYFQENGRSKRADIQNGKLEGAGSKAVKGNFSFIELTLPTTTFLRDFWVERNCDTAGENCLKSNKVSLEKLFPPLLKQLTIDYSSRTGKLMGRNFPPESEEKFSSDFKISFGGKKLSMKEYSEEDNSVTFDLPCPLPQEAIVDISYRDSQSNPLLFTPKDAPYFREISLAPSSKDADKYAYYVKVDDEISLPDSSECVDSPVIKVGGKKYSLRRKGSAYESAAIEFKDIPNDEVDAHLIFEGVESNILPFEFKKHTVKPYIYRLQGKYGFRPGVPFTVYGRNLGNSYKVCSDKEGSVFNGPKIIFEDWVEDFVRFNDNGDRVTKKRCIPYPPLVEPSYMELQFMPEEYGKDLTVTEREVSITAGKIKSNSLVINYGDEKQNVVQSRPIIKSIDYSNGHIPGSSIVVRGNEFGKKPLHNTVSFGKEIAEVESVNSRGTEMTVKIPESDTLTSMTIARKTPNPQKSEEFDVVFSPYKEKMLDFSLPQEQKDEEIVIENAPEKIESSHISVVNSVADLSVHHFVVDVDWKDGNEDSDYSVEKSYIAPFSAFSLYHNGKEVATAVPAVGKKRVSLEFRNFILPITTETEPDTLHIAASVLPMATHESSFSFSFDLKSKKYFSAKNIENNNTVYKEITNTKKMEFDSFSVIKPIDDTCVDADDSNKNCDAYLKMMGRNVEYEKKKTAERVAEIKKSKETTISTAKKIRKNLSEESNSAVKMEEKSESAFARVRSSLSGKKKAKVLAIIEKQKKINAEKKSGIHASASVEQKNSSKKNVTSQKSKMKSLREEYSLAKLLRSLRRDSDKDGLSDVEELLIGTSPQREDTDKDGHTDLIEVEYGFSPVKRGGQVVFDDLSTAGKYTSSFARMILFGVFDDIVDEKSLPQEYVNKMFFSIALARTFFVSDLPNVSKSPYDDVNRNDWYAPYLLLLQQKNISLTEEGNLFAPLKQVSREDACFYVLKAAGIKPKSFVPENLIFPDVSATKKGYVAECAEKKLLVAAGDENGEFGATASIRRAEFAHLLYKTIMSYR